MYNSSCRKIKIMFKNISLSKESKFEIDHSNQTQPNQTETLDWFMIINDLVWFGLVFSKTNRLALVYANLTLLTHIYE